MKRLKPDQRRSQLLTAGLMLASRHGYHTLTRLQVATAAGVEGPLINHYFGSMKQYTGELLQLAVDMECLPVVAQAVVAGELKVNDDLRRRALGSLL